MANILLLGSALKFVPKVIGMNVVSRKLIRKYAGWIKDYKPGPYPVNERQCAKSAEKYNLFPEEYQPYADDGLGYGDYPNIKCGLGLEAKDNYYPYDFPEHKRNLEEPLSVDFDMYHEHRYSQPAPLRFAISTCLFVFMTTMTVAAILFYTFENVKMYRPVAAKQYPSKDTKHFSFET